MTECAGSIQDGKCNGPVGISLSSSAVQVLNLVGLLTSVDAPGRLLLLPSTGRCGLKRERERTGEGRSGTRMRDLVFSPLADDCTLAGKKDKKQRGGKETLCERRRFSPGIRRKTIKDKNPQSPE